VVRKKRKVKWCNYLYLKIKIKLILFINYRDEKEDIVNDKEEDEFSMDLDMPEVEESNNELSDW
jgi:hypothetical protein